MFISNRCLITKRIFVIIVIVIILQGCGSMSVREPEQVVNSNEVRTEKIITSYQEVANTLWYGGQNEEPLDLGDARAPVLLSRAWSLIGSWVEAYLDGHPDASPDDIAACLLKLNVIPPNPKSRDEGYELYGNAIKLAPEIFAVAAHYPLVGTFFVVARNRQGEFRGLWDIKKVASALVNSACGSGTGWKQFRS